MPDISDEKIQEFLSLFDGDIIAARVALDKYKHPSSLTPTSLGGVSSGEAIIILENVTKHYKRGTETIRALSNVSLTIDKGEFVAVTGVSGSGKSTLLQMIGCLDTPTSGKVTIESKQATHLGDDELSELRQNTIGFIFQSFYLQPFLTVSDNLAVPAMFTKEKKKAIDDRVEQLLKQVNLSDRAKHFPKELSGGQIQRAAIARALMNSPRIILADEPTGNLDSINGQAIIDLFRTIRDELGTTIIVVTHDATIARQADRIIELKDGAAL